MALYVHSENKSFFQMIYYVWLLLSLQMCQIILDHPVLVRLCNCLNQDPETPRPLFLPKDIQITTYAVSTTTTVFHTKHRKAQQLIQPYFYKVYEWATTNNLYANIVKTTTALFTLHRPCFI